jgi:hypothetical protein
MCRVPDIHVEVILKRKIVSCVLLASVSFYVGCYNNQTITREELNAISKEDLNTKVEQRDITVFTKDSLEYRFSKENYRIQSDTLTGIGVQMIGGNDNRFHGRIPIADITLIETEAFDLTGTIIAIGLPVGLVGGLLLLFAAKMSEI